MNKLTFKLSWPPFIVSVNFNLCHSRDSYRCKHSGIIYWLYRVPRKENSWYLNNEVIEENHRLDTKIKRHAQLTREFLGKDKKKKIIATNKVGL